MIFDRETNSTCFSIRKLLPLLAFVLASIFATATPPENHRSYLMYVGTYTLEGSESKGVYAYRFNPETNELTSLGLAAESVNPSFLAVHPNHRFLYAVSEVGNYKGKNNGGVSAFVIDSATGKLKLLNEVPSKGADPCYITVDKTGKYVLVANYTGGSVAVFPIQEDGRLGEASAFVQHTGHGTNPKRQEAPHAHSIDLSPDNRFAIVDDLGLDETLVYKLDSAKGSLTPDNPPFAKADSGAGPRHFAFHPGGEFAYVVNEMASTVSVFNYDAAGGVLHPLQTISTLPKGFTGENTDAEIEVHPSGKFLYASNRGADSIAVYSIDSHTGRLTLVEFTPTKGETPRNFEIAPGGKFLFAANEKSDNIVVLRINLQTGRLTPAGKVLDVAQPVCVKFVPID
jgi:6-phosphogluconolactonase